MHRILAIAGFVAATIAPIATDAAPQTGRTPPDDPVKAVNVCMAASHPTNVNGKMPLRDSIEAVWYLLEGVRENRKPGSLAERLSTFPNPDPAEAEVNPSDAPQLLNLCQQRWHNSHRGAIEIMLPVNMFRRNVQCYAIISFVKGMISSDRVTDDDGLGIKIATKMAAYESRLSDRGSRGMASARQASVMLCSNVERSMHSISAISTMWSTPV